jgi:thiol-disulfide isomerase/thioredoxin
LLPFVDGFVPRAIALLVVLLISGLIGLVLRRRAGTARPVSDGAVLAAADLGAPLGDRATFLQFSSPACSPCRSVRRVLGDVVTADPGLAHVDIDATERLDLARRLDIMRTPTVLVLDPDGRVVRRISGALNAEQARIAVPEQLRSR